jgi:hypothetical protein
MSHTEFNIRSILLSVLEECDQANERIILEMDQEEKNKIIIIPSKGELRVEWAKYAQLRLCTKWALDYVFIDVKKVNQSIFFLYRVLIKMIGDLSLGFILLKYYYESF